MEILSDAGLTGSKPANKQWVHVTTLKLFLHSVAIYIETLGAFVKHRVSDVQSALIIAV